MKKIPDNIWRESALLNFFYEFTRAVESLTFPGLTFVYYAKADKHDLNSNTKEKFANNFGTSVKVKALPSKQQIHV